MEIRRSFSLINKNRASLKNIELGILPKDTIKEENESVKDNLNESQEDIINEEESEVENVSGYQFYFEIIISIIMCLNAFFTYSHLNIIHLIYCILLIRSRYTLEYNFWVKSKKTLMIILIIIDIIYLIVKSIFFLIYKFSSLNDTLKIIFIVEDNWRNYYDYIVVSIIIILIIAYLVIAEFDEDFWKASILSKTNNILKQKYLKSNNILNIGLFYITLGASLYPSVINLFILILGFLFFVGMILNKKFRALMKKYTCFIYMFILPFFTIINYTLNSNLIMNNLNDKYYIELVFIVLFKEEGEDSEGEYLIGNIINISSIPFILFVFGFNEINLHLKCLEYNEKKEEEKNMRRHKDSKKKISFLSSFDNDDSYKNERILSLTESLNSERKKNKLQSIFNTNIDCGIIIFTKESSDVDIFTQIKMFLFKFCYTPAFCLHICRLSVVLWVNCYITYDSIILIVWLFISIHFSNKKFFFIITKMIVFPLLGINFFVSYISNIQGTSLNSQFFGLIYYKSPRNRLFHMANKLIIITVFQMYLHLKTKHTQLIKNPDIKREIKIQEKELENVLKYDFNGKYVTKPLELFFKGYFLILDFLVIISFYLAITQTINILNQIGLLFLISIFLLNNKSYRTVGIYVCLIILNISFIIKYIVHFFYENMQTIDSISKAELILSIIFHDYLYNIHYYWITYYILFLEYISQSSKLFKICYSKTISVHELIEFNLGTHNYIKLVLSTLTNFVFGIYIWLLIPCFVACLIMQDNNLIFLFQLLILFFIYYNYIQIANNNYSDLDRVSKIFKYTWCLIFTTILNLTIIYFMQFLNKRPISVVYSLFSFKTKKFLEVTGLFVFTGKYSRHMACFFIMFILSVALHMEIGRQIKLNTVNIEIKNTVKKYSLSNFQNKTQKIAVFRHLQTFVENNNNEDDYSIKRKEKLNLKENSVLSLTHLESKKEKEKMKKKIKKRKTEKQKATQMIYRLYIVLYYILHYYWIIIFVFISIIAFHWMLSFSMALQLSLFCFYIAKSFKVYYNYFNRLSLSQNELLTIKKKINRHVEERLERFKTTSDTQQEYFKYLWFFTFAFIIVSYLCSILLKIIKAFSKTYPEDETIEKIYEYLSALMYILGFYSINEDDDTKRIFLTYSWGYLIIIELFSIRTYLATKFNEIQSIYFDEQNKREKIIKTSKRLDNFKFNDINLLINANENIPNNINNKEEENDDFDLYLNDISKRFKLGSKKKKTKGTENDEINIIKRKLSYDLSRPKIGKRELKEYLKEKKLFIYSKDDFGINYRESFRNKNVESSLTIQQGVKKFLELLVIILIIINAVTKCNIISFILLIILIFTYNYDHLSTRIMFQISFLLLILLVLQYLVFVTNISYYTNPFSNNEVVRYITKRFKIPWSSYIGYRWATFFSLGTNRYQIRSLWVDVTIILVLYFYLEFFSYSIYINDYKSEKINKVIAKYNKKFKDLQTMNENEYKSFVRAMKVSYNIELKTKVKRSEREKKTSSKKTNLSNYTPRTYNRKMLELCYYFGRDMRYLDIIKSDTIKGFMTLRNYFYLSFHYILLLSILLISLINQGLIVLGYMSFSIFYLYKSHCFLKGRRWTLLKGIHTFMKPYLFIDILSHLIFQIPFRKFITHRETLQQFFKELGYVEIVDYSLRENILKSESYNVFLKILCYFLILIQENIYTSYDFKKFILQYHYEYLQKAFIKGKLYSFLFNNYRVSLMNDRLKQRKEINETLNNILCTITRWNIHLRSYNEGNNIVADLYKATPGKNNEKKREGGITVGQIVKKHWLISLALQIFESSFTVDDEHYNVSGDILKILKGSTMLNSELDDLIDLFERRNYEKYGDIENIKGILEKKRKLKEEEKQKKKLKKKDKDNKNNKKSFVSTSKKGSMIGLDETKFHKKGSAISITEYDKYLKLHKKATNKYSIISSDYSISKINNNDDEDSSKDNLNIIAHTATMRLPNDTVFKGFRNIGTKNTITNRLRPRDLRNSVFCIGEEMSLSRDSDKNDTIQILEETNTNIINTNTSNINNNINNNHNIIKKSDSNNNRFIKLDQPYDDMFFAHSDYRELKEEIRQDFFLHYCSKKRIVLILIKSIFNFFSENFEYTVFFFMILNHLVYGSGTSLIFAFLALILGITQYPRPSKLFWKITLIYCTIIVFLKFVLQLCIWDRDNFNEFTKIFNKNKISTLIGIYKLNTYYFTDFFGFVIFDFLVLTSLIVNQFILLRKGLWYMTEIDYESIEEANDRIIKYNKGKKAAKLGLHINSQKILTSNEIIRIIGKVLPPRKGNLKKIVHGFYRKNFSHIRNEKPGKDFYIEYTSFQILILIYIILLYTMMEKDTLSFNVEDLFSIFKLEKFSGRMAICAFIHVFLLVFDRFIYLKNTRKLKKIDFKIYSKRTGEDITIRYKNFTYLDALNKLNEKDFEIVSYQYEGCQTGLLMKFGLQIATVLGIHIFIFFYFPLSSVEDDNSLRENNFLLYFYLLYIFYFVFSGLQIKYGLSDLRKMSGLMKSSNLLHSLFYKTFRAIPFLFEIKNFVDWTFTTTSLDLWKWLKFEEVISLLYLNKCYAKGNMHRRIGTKIPIYMKFLLGGSLFFFMIMLVFGPILVYSSLNPTNTIKKVIGANLKIQLKIPPDYRINLLDLHNTIITNFTDQEEYNNYFNERDSDSNVSQYTSSFEYTQAHKVKILGISESNWEISPFLFDNLENNKIDTYNISLLYSFTIEDDTSSSDYYGKETDQSIPFDTLKEIYNISFDKNPKKNSVTIPLTKALSPYQQIKSGKPEVLSKQKRNINLVLNRKEIGDMIYLNWNIQSGKDNNCEFEFITFSNFYSSLTFGMNVITFYVSFILVIGRVISGAFLGQAERIMYAEMVNPGKLFSVCEGIKISRIKKDFLQEEKLYYLLIDFMRSPEMFKNLTMSSLIYIQDNNIGREEIKYREYEVESRALISNKKYNKRLANAVRK